MPVDPNEPEPEIDPLLAGYWGPERKQPDGSIKQSWIFTHPDHRTNKQTEQGAAPLPIGQTNGVNNEQANLGGDRLRPIAFDDNDTRPASRSADDNGLAEVEIDGKVSNETNQANSRPVVDGDPTNSGNQHPLGTVRDGDRLDVDNGKDTVMSSPVPATSTGNDEPFLLATGTDGNVVLPFRKRLPVQEPVLVASTGSVENKRVIIRPSDCPIWWEKLPEAAQEYWHLYEWRGKYEHTKHQSGRIRVFVLYGPKWDKNTKELIRAGTGEFITGRVRPYDAFIPEETYQLLRDEGYEKK